MNPVPKKENNISWQALEGSDLSERQKEVLDDACQKTGFVPKKLVSTSAWWRSAKIGAFHYSGEFQSKDAVLKIQGIKPSTSEIYMIQSFDQFNQSKIVRPPRLYTSLPWDDTKKYEALILEAIKGKKIINLPATEEEIAHYFSLYNEYKKNCINHPWIDQSSESIPQKIQMNFDKWRQISFKIYPTHPLRQDTDIDLIDKAVSVLAKRYGYVSSQFQHGHLGDGDLIQKNNEVIILSNLYWSWKAPFYDAVFAYHWYIYHLADIPNMSPENIESQRDLWLDKIYELVQAPGDIRLIRLALLERAAAGLNLDALSLDPNKPITTYLIESTRTLVSKLTQELS